MPADAKAAVISPSIVGDRFVQLTPAYTGGDVLEDNARLGEDRTATPLELDEIFSSINDLNIALGPEGANKPTTAASALTRLLDSTARNFGGQGVEFNKTLKNLGALTKTLADNKDELFGTLAQARGVHQDAGRRTTTPSASSTTRLAGGRRPARRRAPGTRCRAEEPEHRDGAGSRLREGEPGLADPNIAGLTGSPRSWSSGGTRWTRR